MSTIKKRKNKINKLIGIIIILIGIILLCSKYTYMHYLELQNNKKIDDYFTIQEESKDITNDEVVSEEIKPEKTISYDYIGILEISKINLKQGFVSKDSPYNRVDKNIQVIKESDMPDVVNGNLIIAGHSGSSRVSYFRKLPNLSIDDEATVYYNNKIYKYKLVNTYEIEKTGYANIIRNKEKTVLTLITCKSKTNLQIVFIFELQEIM